MENKIFVPKLLNGSSAEDEEDPDLGSVINLGVPEGEEEVPVDEEGCEEDEEEVFEWLHSFGGSVIGEKLDLRVQYVDEKKNVNLVEAGDLIMVDCEDSNPLEIINLVNRLLRVHQANLEFVELDIGSDDYVFAVREFTAHPQVEFEDVEDIEKE